MFLIKEGNHYNGPVQLYYIESASDTSDIPDTAPVGSVALVNDSTDGFSVAMKDSNDTWNTISGAVLAISI